MIILIQNNRQEHIRKIAREFFQEPSIIGDYYYSNLISGDIQAPDYGEGEVILKIIELKSETTYGKYAGNVKVEVIFEDGKGKNLNQIFILENGKNNNFGKFIYQVIGEELQDDFKLSELIGRKIVATIHHYYNDSGLGYANIAFCRPVENRTEE